MAAVKESVEPLWITVWGGTNVIAEALQHIRQTETLEVEASLHSRLRIYAISDQDDTGEWIRNTFPSVFYIASIHGFGAFDMAAWQGISHPISRGDMNKVSPDWLRTNIQKGPLGAVYPTSMHIMEGDTPTFLYLIQNGLGSPEWPNFGSWGGRYRPINVGSAHYADVVDTILDAGDETKRTDQKATICRWRDAFQNDFAMRMAWTLEPDFSTVSHPPIPIIDGIRGPGFIRRSVKSGEAVVLDASASYNPDRPDGSGGLDFQWYQYAEPTINHPIGAEATPRCVMRPLTPPVGTGGRLPKNDCGFQDVVLGPWLEITVPDGKVPGLFGLPAHHWLAYTGLVGMEYHIILQVTNTDAPLPISRYLRVILDAGMS